MRMDSNSTQEEAFGHCSILALPAFDALLAEYWHQTHTPGPSNGFADFALAAPCQSRQVARLNLAHVCHVVGQQDRVLVRVIVQGRMSRIQAELVQCILLLGFLPAGPEKRWCNSSLLSSAHICWCW